MFVHLLTPKKGPPIELGRITVVLGANQSGKSTLLRDVFRLATGRDPGSDYEQVQHVETVLLGDMQYGGSLRDEELLRQALPGEGETRVLEGLGGDLRRVCRATLRPEALSIVKRPVLHARSVLQSELPEVMLQRVAFLADETLDHAADGCPAAGPLDSPRTLLQLLESSTPETQAEVDAAFVAAFPPLGLRLDTSERVRLKLRIGEEFPEEPTRDARAEVVARAQRWQAMPALDEAGRGCRQLATVVLSVTLLPGRILLVDEPDAHLQPFAARQLGRWLARAVAEHDSQLIVAARGASLVAGLVERSGEVVMVRLSRRGRESKLWAAPAETVRDVARSAVLPLDEALGALQRQGTVLVDSPGEALAIDALNSQRGGADRWSVVCVHSMRHAAPLLKLYRDTGLPSALVARLAGLKEKVEFARLVDASLRGDPPPSNWLATRDQLARHVESNVDRKAMAANTRAMEQFLDGLRTKAPPAVDMPDDRGLDPWQRIAIDAMTAIPADQRPWVEQLLEELKGAGLFFLPFPARAMGLGEGLAGEIEKLLRDIRAGQPPDRLAVLYTEVAQYLRQAL